jgi:hypothetical protein
MLLPVALAIFAVISRLQRPIPFRQLLRGLHGGCDDSLSSNDDVVKNWGLSDSTTCGDSAGLGVIEGSSNMNTLPRNHGMLSIARRSVLAHCFSCNTKTEATEMRGGLKMVSSKP